MATNPTLTPVLNSEWTRSHAATPDAIPPHPALLSGGWYHGTSVELVGPGRMPLSRLRAKSAGLAFVLSVLFGPVGLCYVSVNAGLVATALTAGTLLVAGAGFVPLLVIWPLCVLGSVWGAGHVRVSS
ncbi:MAG TPA: hypothetical protein VGP26_01820 [Actinophytocola sp.]|jgi:hypothetical protein|nr:hypothetical protein [Actinophytocola sp.]